MIVISANDVPDNKIPTFPYRGENLEVKETYIRWLSQAGPEDAPDYGLRFFTMGPGGLSQFTNIFIIRPCSFWRGACSLPATMQKRTKK